MNLMVVGLGSMGKRRIRLLSENFSDIKIIGIDSSQERINQVEELHGIVCYSNIYEALIEWSVDTAFICTPPLTHHKIIRELLTEGVHIFTELNLVSDGYPENIDLAKQSNKVLFLSSTLLYRNETRFLIERIHKAKGKLNYTYHVGQYLPDWHPWENYQDFFVADARSNGCREIFAVELPWILQAFGKVSDNFVNKGTISSLSLQYPDSYLVTLEHELGHKGQIMVDVVTRVPVRHFEVFGEHLQMEWRGTPEQLWTADEGFSKLIQVDLQHYANRVSGYRDFITEDAYLEEMKEFFAIIDGKEYTSYGFTDDLYTLELIDRIEAQ